MLPSLSPHTGKLGLQHKHDPAQREKKSSIRSPKPSSKAMFSSRNTKSLQLSSPKSGIQKTADMPFDGESTNKCIRLPPIENCKPQRIRNKYEKRTHDVDNEGDSSGCSTSTTTFPLHTIPDILSCDTMVLSDMSPAQTIDINVKIGLQSFNRAQYANALSYLDRSILQNPGLFLSRFVRGLCNYNLMHLHTAERDFTICCQAHHSRDDHDQALAFHNRSVIRIRLDETEKAMDDINKAISLDSFENSFYKNRALLYRRSGNFEAAKHDYEIIRRQKETNNVSLQLCMGNLSARQDPYELRPYAIPPRKRGINTRSDSSKRLNIGRRSTQKRSRFEEGLKASIYGQAHAALTCIPHQRTKDQLDLLVKESKMMVAFGHLDSDQLYTLWRYLEYHKYPSNLRIFEEGDIAEDYSVVWSGSVSARITKKNEFIQDANFVSALMMEHEFIVNTMVAGDALGEASIFDDGTRKASCVTEEPSEILTINKKHFDKTFKVFLEKSHNQKMAYLSRFDFLSNWKREKLEALAYLCRERKYHAGDQILHQGDVADSLSFIKRGIVSIIRSVEGPKTSYEICVAKLYAGDIIGEATILNLNGLGLFPSSVRCETLTTCYRLDSMQVKREDWDLETRTKLSASSVSYPDDSFLLRSYVNEMQFKKKHSNIIKTIKNSYNKYTRSARRLGHPIY